MAATETDSPPRRTVEPPAPDGHARVWFAVLVVGLLVAAPILRSFGRDQWFFLDDWVFLVNRRLTDVSGLLQPHNSHWVTLPVIAYRVLFRAFGLRYLPFQMLAVLLHLGVIVLLWCTARRLRVRPAIATLTLLPFAFYGAGRSNILFGFQIALTGSIVFGLAHLLLATDDEPSPRRDLAGILLGLGAIMCSAVGIPMVVGTAVAVLIRRGWRAAALHAVPLGVVYAVWYVAYARGEAHQYDLGTDTISFAWNMGKAAFVGFGQNGVVGLALAAVALVGVARAVQVARSDRHSGVPAIVAALFTSALAFALLTGFGRAGFGVGSAVTDRYIYVVAALALPVIALGAELLARYWIVLAILPLVLLAIGLPDNIDRLRYVSPFTNGSRELVTAAAYSPLLRQLPRDTRIFSLPATPEVAPTVGFLESAVAAGRLPRSGHVSPQIRADAASRIVLHQTGAGRRRDCPTGAPTRAITAARGTRIVFSGLIAISVRWRGAASVPVPPFDSRAGAAIDVRAGPVKLVIGGVLGHPPAICRISTR